MKTLSKKQQKHQSTLHYFIGKIVLDACLLKDISVFTQKLYSHFLDKWVTISEKF